MIVPVPTFAAGAGDFTSFLDAALLAVGLMAATFFEESVNGWETEAFGFAAGLLPSEGSPFLGEGACFVPATFFGAAAFFGVGAL